MAKENARFVAVERLKKPARLKFRTKSGAIVSFQVLKTVRKRRTARSRAKKK
jgi:hypothetical protein